MHFDRTITTGGDAKALFYVIRDGIEAEERRKQRRRNGKREAEDMKPDREI
jgi:hypothetical protein